MPNVFKPARAKDVGTSFVTLYTTPTGLTSFIAEIDCANVTTTGVVVDVVIESGGQDYHIIKEALVSPGSTLSVVTEQRVVLDGDEILKIKSNIAASLDINVSILEDINN